MIADIHCHPSLHPFGNKEAGKRKGANLWDYDPPKSRQRKSKYPEFTQADFTSLARSGVKLIYASLYPIEQGWLNPVVFGDSIFSDIAAKFISRLPKRYVDKIQSSEYNYYRYLHKEYDYLMNGSGKKNMVNGNEWQYLVVDSGEKLQQVINDDRTIAVVPSIEGAQAFVSGNAYMLEHGGMSLKRTLNNIHNVKNWACPPFFVSLSHHFFNALCGHAKSIPSPGSALLKQGIGLNEPINSNGQEVIDCLLGMNDYAGNGRRILIDTKHMSVAARLQYYQLIGAYNKKNSDTKIPIIISHAAYSGHKSLTGSINRPDTDNTKYAASTDFNNWSINLTGEDIIEVFKSAGIIGLNFDERILSGNKLLETYNDTFSRREIKSDDPAILHFWAKQILNQIKAIVKAVINDKYIPKVSKKQVWNMISIGSDFDGMINPIDGCITAEDFPRMGDAITTAIKSDLEMKDLLLGLSVEEVMDKFMFRNAYEFAVKHYGS